MKHFAVILVLLTGFLFGCGPGGEFKFEVSSVPSLLRNFHGLTVSSLYPDPDNVAICPVNGLNAPGQGPRLQGSNGGLDYVPITLTTDAGSVGLNLKKAFFSTTPLDSHVAILVIDDFNNGVFELGNEVFRGSDFSEARLEWLQTNRHLSHGALVVRHTNDLITGTGRYTLLSKGNGIWTYKEKSTGKTLTVKAVNTWLPNPPVDRVAHIATQTRAALQTLPAGTSLAVLNMSFVFLPCGIYDDFVAWDKWTPNFKELFADYLEAVMIKKENVALFDINGNGRVEGDEATKNSLVDTLGEMNLAKAIIDSTNRPNDPLLQLIQHPAYGATRYVYVGATGNYALPYSMYPANWKGVINVSGSTVDNLATSTNETRKRDTRLFNQGEIMHLAASFKLNPPSNVLWSKPVYYFGTSYAAPEITVFSALDLAGPKRCANGFNISKLAVNHLSLVDRHLEDWVVNNVIIEKGAVTLLCP